MLFYLLLFTQSFQTQLPTQGGPVLHQLIVGVAQISEPRRFPLVSGEGAWESRKTLKLQTVESKKYRITSQVMASSFCVTSHEQKNIAIFLFWAQAQSPGEPAAPTLCVFSQLKSPLEESQVKAEIEWKRWIR